MGKGSNTGSIMGVIRTPLGIVILFIILLVLAGLSVASAISGELTCLLYTSDAADDTPCVDLGGRRIIK